MQYIDIQKVKEIFKKGQSISEFLKKEYNVKINTSEIIETTYDLLASLKTPSEINTKEKNASEKAKILEHFIDPGNSLIDVGTGELRMLTPILNNINIEFSNIFAFDISWSRLKKGSFFYSQNNKKKKNRLHTFVADMKEIPFQDKCIDILMSNHSLEPNGAYLPVMLCELFRITKKKLVLFEPSYELNSKEGKKRMDKLGYIKNIEKEVSKLNGKVIDIIPIKYSLNPLNPTACYIIQPPDDCSKIIKTKPIFSVPGTNFKLKKVNSFMESRDTGLIFPILDKIPILRKKSAILASAKFI